MESVCDVSFKITAKLSFPQTFEDRPPKEEQTHFFTSNIKIYMNEIS